MRQRHSVLPMKQDASTAGTVDDLVRKRLRELRLARGWTLDELGRRANLGASTISRIETGHRRLAVDTLAHLARALETSVDALLDTDDEEDVVIRPVRTRAENGAVHWPLSRTEDPSGRRVMKLRLPQGKGRPDPRVHPGRDWFYVLSGRARLVLGTREHLVETGQAAEFDTMTPHWIAGHGGPVELLVIFDRDGRRLHLDTTDRPRPASR